jgi:hypothetical protein
MLFQHSYSKPFRKIQEGVGSLNSLIILVIIFTLFVLICARSSIFSEGLSFRLKKVGRFRMLNRQKVFKVFMFCLPVMEV